MACGADVDVKANDGDWTPLHNAAEYGRLEVVRLLVACGAAMDVKEGEEKTALTVAQEHNKTECVRFLTEAGAR